MIIAIIVHSIIALSFLADPEYSFLSIVVGVLVLINIIGVVLIQSGKKMAGAKVFLVASALMVPIGLIGVFGARKIIDEETRKNFYNSAEN